MVEKDFHCLACVYIEKMMEKQCSEMQKLILCERTKAQHCKMIKQLQTSY